MPLIFTREYIYAVAVAIVATALAKRAGLSHRVLWPAATVAIILALWLLGLSPLGFAVSWGGWIVFLLTVLVGRLIQRIVIAVGN